MIPPIFNKVIAVDFDGTLFKKAKYPEFGAPNQKLIQTLIDLQQKQECKLILWTCREGELLDRAVRACGQCGLRFDAINDCIPERAAKYGNSRKVGADIYLDDKSVNVLDFSKLPYRLQPGIWKEAIK